MALAVAVGLVGAAPASADDGRLDWPLRPPPALDRGARGFDAVAGPTESTTDSA
ncbi:hypothetical protein [Mycobacterium alsense]|uniref:hypothetical protein n=1 Tax=Mycobacterium alsense TaxID=324058 RepID=UPI001A9729D4|nr:hypothetical protein [Mycobacterium alsense]